VGAQRHSGVIRRCLAVPPRPKSLCWTCCRVWPILARRPLPCFLKEERAAERFFDFFTANIQNKHTRRAYYNAACKFSEFCAKCGAHDLAHVKPASSVSFPHYERGSNVMEYFSIFISSVLMPSDFIALTIFLRLDEGIREPRYTWVTQDLSLYNAFPSDANILHSRS
jgi:hypothetical protein